MRLKALPAVADHRVGGFVGGWAAGELGGEQPCGVRGELGLEVLAVLDHSLGVVGIENLGQFIELRRLGCNIRTK